MIPLFKVFMAEDAPAMVGEVLRSGYVGQGPKVEEFEGALSEYLGTTYCNTVNSGTSGLELALRMIDREYGTPQRKTILTTPLTCTATSCAILAAGLRIEWVDVDPMTCNLDLIDLRRKIGPHVLGIMAVHWGGYPCDLDEIDAICRQCDDLYCYRPMVVEDCAHAFGSTYKGKKLGRHGNFCVYSFQAIKSLTTVDGGLLVSPSDFWHRSAKLLRWYGLDRTSSADFRCAQNIKDWGFKFQMNDVAAQVGLCNLKHIDEILRRHRENAAFFRKEIMTLDLRNLENLPDRESSFWIYTVRVERRDDFIRHMKDCGIHVGRVHDRNDKHECFKEFRRPLPRTDEICADMVCLPCGWWVSSEDRQHIIRSMQKGW